MRSCQFLTFCLLLSLVSIAGAQTPAPSDVHVKLSLADNKTVYRIGEPIKLVMEFTGDREGYVVEYMPDGKQPGLDTIVGQIERELILALTGGKSFKLSPERTRELQMSCITTLCKEYFSRVP